MRSNPRAMPSVSGQLCVVRTDPANDPVGEHPAAGPARGFTPLEQTVLVLGAGESARRTTDAAEETLFVAAGDGELMTAGGEQHQLTTESGAYLRPGEEYELTAGPEGMRMISVRIPDPAPPSAAGTAPLTVRRLEDQAVQEATTERRFQIVADPSTGLRSATHFVGYVPVARAPRHFHTYDEVIYVLEGDGLFHAPDAVHPLRPGTCIGLPARTVHCLENTGPGEMRLVAVFRPAGSPAAAYYPDGTPAYEGVDPIPQT